MLGYTEKKVFFFYDLCYTNPINLKLYSDIVMERADHDRPEIFMVSKSEKSITSREFFVEKENIHDA